MSIYIVSFIQIFIQNTQKIRYMSASDIHKTFSVIPFLNPFSVFILTTYKYTQVTEKYQPDMELQYTHACSSYQNLKCHYFSKSNGLGSQIYYTYKQPDKWIIQFGVVQEIIFSIKSFPFTVFQLASPCNVYFICTKSGK